MSAKPKVITYNIQFDERFLFGVNKKNVGEDYLQEAAIVQT